MIFCLSMLACQHSGHSDSIKSISGKKGVVAAGDSLAVQAGLSILGQGGNAADAAVAVILALSIGDFKDFCVGSEAPFMIYDKKSASVKVLSGQGRAPLDPEAVQWYYEFGIPANNIKAAAVPAIIDLCVTVLRLYGTQSFEFVAQPALAMLTTCEKQWYAQLSATLGKLIETEKGCAGSREEKLQAARDRFYRGDIADSLVVWYQKNGGFLGKEDLALHQTRVEDPVAINYRGYEVYKCDTWTQGPVLLQTLKLLEGFDLKSMGHLTPEAIHTISEALKLALADRDTYYGDPLFTDVPLDILLSDEYTILRRSLIDADRASDTCRPGDPRNMKAILQNGRYLPAGHGTTSCCVADRWGNVVACTPSGWGSDAGAGGSTGVTHGTRLLSLNTLPGHPNSMKPGKRPRITLTPTLVLKDGDPLLAISVVGGDLQDQTTLNVLLNILEFHLSPSEAVSVPRFATYLHENSFNPSSNRASTIDPKRHLLLSAELPGQTLDDLKIKGHRIEMTADAIAEPVCIQIDQKSGVATAAAELRKPHFVGAVY